MGNETPMGKIVVYIRSPDGEERDLLCEHDFAPEIGNDRMAWRKAFADALFEISLGERTPSDGARFLLNMRDVKGNARRQLKTIIKRAACKQCLIENKGTCLEGHTEEWVKIIKALL